MKVLSTKGIGPQDIILDLDGTACDLIDEPLDDQIRHGQIGLTAQAARQLGVDLIAASDELLSPANALGASEHNALCREDVTVRVLAALQSRSTQCTESRVILVECMTSSFSLMVSPSKAVEKPIKWAISDVKDMPESLLTQIEKMVPPSTRIITKEDLLVVYDRGLLIGGVLRVAIGYANLRVQNTVDDNPEIG